MTVETASCKATSMRIVLKKPYDANGKDLGECIENCRSLPRAASKAALHRLRQLVNDVLHFNEKEARLPKDFEKELLSLLLVLRELIEGAPAWRLR